MRGLLVGENIRLTSVSEEDFVSVYEWYNDIEFLRYYDMVPAIPKNISSVKKVIDEFEVSDNRFIFAIRPIYSNDIIGVIGFDDIIWSNGTATFFIGIGNKKFTGMGYGRAAMNLIIDYGFNELNFHRIQLNVLEYNLSAIGLYESIGFKREGTYREFIHRDSKRYDMYLYGLLKSEWIAK